MGRILFVVARDRPDLYKYLTWHFAGEKDVEVTLDRREKERRDQAAAPEQERRRANRRRKQPNHRNDPFSFSGVITIQIDPGPPVPADKTPLSDPSSVNPASRRVELRIGERLGSFAEDPTIDLFELLGEEEAREYGAQKLTKEERLRITNLILLLARNLRRGPASLASGDRA